MVASQTACSNLLDIFNTLSKYPFIKANPTIPNHKSSHPEPRRHSCHVKAGHQPWLSLAMLRAMYMTVHALLPYPVCMLMFERAVELPQGWWLSGMDLKKGPRFKPTWVQVKLLQALCQWTWLGGPTPCQVESAVLCFKRKREQWSWLSGSCASQQGHNSETSGSSLWHRTFTTVAAW